MTLRRRLPDWILNAYAIIFGALLIPAGRMADKYGRRNAFVVGLAVFVLASLACALAPDLWALVGFRCLQIKNVDSGPIDYGTPGYPVAVYRPHGSRRPLS